jgi:hypothetical protein
MLPMIKAVIERTTKDVLVISKNFHHFEFECPSNTSHNLLLTLAHRKPMK